MLCGRCRGDPRTRNVDIQQMPPIYLTCTLAATRTPGHHSNITSSQPTNHSDRVRLSAFPIHCLLATLLFDLLKTTSPSQWRLGHSKRDSTICQCLTMVTRPIPRARLASSFCLTKINY